MMRGLFSNRRLPYAIVSRVLGVLLLAAAALKLHGLAIDPAGHGGVFSAPEWQVGIVEIEIFLGIWLLSGNRPIGSWLGAQLAFGCFAAASFYQGWVGQASCGCFGAVAVNPWLTFSLDVAMMTALALGRPDLQPLRESPRAILTAALLPVAGGFLGTAAILGLLAGIAHASFGSTQGALAYLRGERISVSPRLLDMGEGQPGEVREASVQLHNWTDKPVHLYGGTSDCSCVATDDLPITIAPGEGRAIRVKMRLPAANGAFNRTAFLMTDDDETRTLMFRLTGHIHKSDEQAITAQGSGG
jgi:hypothetical protein